MVHISQKRIEKERQFCVTLRMVNMNFERCVALLYLLLVKFTSNVYTYNSVRIPGMLYGLEEDNFKSEILGGTTHECFRNCRLGETKTCNYTFVLSQYTSMSYACGDCPFKRRDCYRHGCIIAGGNKRSVTVANHMLPGPSIEVCEGDTIRVKVVNAFSSESTTLHWHGIHQVDSPYMDGTPYLTQCPILPHNSFTYKFEARPAGTHIWHSHMGFEEADGLHGNLIVRRADDPLSKYYDYDLSEHVILIWHWYDHSTGPLLMGDLHTYTNSIGYGFLINGQAPHVKYTRDNQTYYTPRETFTVNKGKRYRFRVIQNSAIYCPIELSIDGHKLLVIASDGGSFEPIEVDSFVINSGERFDFVLTTDQKPDNYWIRFRGYGSCDGKDRLVTEKAILHYSNVKFEEPKNDVLLDRKIHSAVVLNPVRTEKVEYFKDSLVSIVDLNNTRRPVHNISGEPDHKIYLKFSMNLYESFHSPGPYPQINDLSFEYPAVPLLTQHEDVSESAYCNGTNTNAKDCNKGFCVCPVVYKVMKDSLVEIIFIDTTEARATWQHHPMHLHGYSFYVVAMDTYIKNASFEEIKYLNEAGLIKKNIHTPVEKDTISVPAAGYAIVRFRATNPGYWFLHCHITIHAEHGMGVVLKVGNDNEMIQPPDKFPRCGNWDLDSV